MNKRRPPPRPEELPQAKARIDAKRSVRAWAEENGHVDLLDEAEEREDPRLRTLREATLERVEARADYERVEADATEAIAKYEIALATAQEAVELQQRAVARYEVAQAAHLAAFRAARHLALAIGERAFAKIAWLDGQLTPEGDADDELELGDG